MVVWKSPKQAPGAIFSDHLPRSCCLIAPSVPDDENVGDWAEERFLYSILNTRTCLASALARYRELEDVIVMLGVDELSVQDRTLVRRARRLQRFLTQPFTVSEVFTGRKGARVPLEETLLVCERILDGAADAVEEQRLYMRGGLESFEEALQ